MLGVKTNGRTRARVRRIAGLFLFLMATSVAVAQLPTATILGVVTHCDSTERPKRAGLLPYNEVG